jgi:polysaccharide biosynthesis protein VpsQ
MRLKSVLIYENCFFSDIHGNATALETVLEEIKIPNVEKVYELGDICYRGPEPQRSVELVKELNTEVIKGNADEWIVRGIQKGEVPDHSLDDSHRILFICLIQRTVLMLLILKKLFFIFLAISYVVFIWIQSGYFDPESLVGISSTLNRTVYLFIGASLEFAHLFQFGLLYLCIVLIFLSFGRLRTWQEVTAAVIALAYGIVDEIHQLYVPFRSFSIGDLLKDAIGIVVFWWVVHRSYFYKKSSKLGRWLRSLT